MNKVLFNDDAKNALIDGVNLIGRAVATTFGPNGKNVIIQGNSGIYITKDGATAARFMKNDDPAINAGVELIKKIATKTATDVGDGTTTATILATELINNLQNNKENPIKVNKILNKEVEKVVEYLSENKKVISELNDLIKVATISTNNDEILGRLVAETYYNVTKDGIINVCESQDIKDSVVYSKGIKLESGFTSAHFVNTQKGTCELNNVLVGIFRTPINELKEITDICEKAIKEKLALLIIAPKIDSSILRTLLLNNASGNLYSCCVSSPNHGVFRETMLSDVENILGDTMICEKIIVSKDTSFIVGGTPNKYIIDNKINEIKNTLELKAVSDFELEFARKRLANYVGGIATILVGGYSDVEIKEKKDRLDDAVCSVKAAMSDGILPGGGVALARACANLELVYLKDVLLKPIYLLNETSEGLLDFNNDDNFWIGKDFKTNKKGNMYDMGIVDPFLVTKIALENAISVASLILTNGCTIININE